MKKFLLFSLLSLVVCGFAERFDDLYTGMSFEIPQDFTFDESKSNVKTEEGDWWYTFCDEEENLLVIEIDENCRMQPLSEFFHNSLTEIPEFESIIYSGMEFKNLEIDTLKATKYKLRILAVAENVIEPLYFCDYLFVKGCFNFSISLTAKEKSLASNAEREAMMFSLIHSIQFSP